MDRPTTRAARGRGGRPRHQASLQQGQRRGGEDRHPPGAGRFVLIVDADGQHRPADAARLVARLDEYDLVVGARSPGSQAGLARRVGNAILNGLASYLTGRRIPDLTSGFRAARRECLLEFLHLLPNGFSTPTTTTLAFMKAGYSVRFEPIEAAQRQGRRRSGSDRTARFLPDPAEGDHDFQPAAHLSAVERRRVSSPAPATPCGRSRRSRTSPIRRCC